MDANSLNQGDQIRLLQETEEDFSNIINIIENRKLLEDAEKFTKESQDVVELAHAFASLHRQIAYLVHFEMYNAEWVDMFGSVTAALVARAINIGIERGKREAVLSSVFVNDDAV